MFDSVKAIRDRLTEEDAYFLRKIYEPTVMAVPYTNAIHDLCVQPDGELRCYGMMTDPRGGIPHTGEYVYQSSVDGGLTWKIRRHDAKQVGPGVISPYSGRYMGMDSFQQYGRDTLKVRITAPGGNADSTDYAVVPVGDRVNLGCYRLPMALSSVQRWIIAGERDGHAVFFLSDDDGDNWRAVDIPQSDHFELKPPHKSPRWENSGIEPSVVELSDGTLTAMLRTSTDFHYVTYSHDHGETWTKSVPSTFRSTLTNPFLLRLQDGRTLFFYNNTAPLPEIDKTAVVPPLFEHELTGESEDVFTNRDANCVVISENDGQDWIGFRELLLTPVRNNADFRSVGGAGSSLDKSVHQYQAIELPFGKVLVHVGQNESSRRLVIFDVNWLYEKQRREDFKCGMGALSTHVYLKSLTGNYRGFAGHCAWNRISGAVMMPDPLGDTTEALFIRNVADDRLFNGHQGMVWNFPAAKRGEVTIRVMCQGTGALVSLLDHWINPCDPTVEDDAQMTYVAPGGATDWCRLTVRFDTEAGEAIVSADGAEACRRPIGTAPNGLCYLHIRTLAETGDCAGTYIKELLFDGE